MAKLYTVAWCNGKANDWFTTHQEAIEAVVTRYPAADCRREEGAKDGEICTLCWEDEGGELRLVAHVAKVDEEPMLPACTPIYRRYSEMTGAANPQLRQALDAARWPGGRAAGFQLWISRMWRAYGVTTGEQPEWGGGWSDRQIAKFGAFLEGEEAQAETDAWCEEEGIKVRLMG